MIGEIQLNNSTTLYYHIVLDSNNTQPPASKDMRDTPPQESIQKDTLQEPEERFEVKEDRHDDGQVS